MFMRFNSNQAKNESIIRYFVKNPITLRLKILYMSISQTLANKIYHIFSA